MSKEIDVKLLIRGRQLAEKIEQEIKNTKSVLMVKDAYRNSSNMYLDQEKAEKECYLYNIVATFKSEYSARKFAKTHDTKFHKSHWASKFDEGPYLIWIG